MSTFISLPVSGSIYFKDAVDTAANLPDGQAIGEVRFTIDDSNFNYWDGSSWNLVTGGFITSVTDSDSIDQTVSSGALSSVLRISANAATSGYLKATTTVKSTGSVGIHVEVPISDTNTTGVLTDTDWDTFNNKEPAISATSTADYYRGDKSFQTLNIAALGVETGGNAASSGKIGQIISSEVTTQVTTNVGATGVYGYVTSISLTAGVWLINGVVLFDDNGAAITDFVSAGISSSATASGIGSFDIVKLNSVNIGDVSITPTPSIHVNISSTTTYYLNTLFNYTSGTPKHGGKVWAIRIR